MLNRVKNALEMPFGTSKTSKIARLRRAISHLAKFLVGDHKTSQIQDFQNFGGGGGKGGPPDQKKIKQSVLFTRISEAIVTKIEKDLKNDFLSAQIDTFETRLTEREAFRKLISHPVAAGPAALESLG